MTIAERVAAGRDARTVVSRRELGLYEPASDRPDPVTILEEQGRDRQQDLLPLRRGRMAASPFAFLRGAAAVMAADLAAGPVTGLTVQAIGDAHVANFGVFATPERRMMFDVNDFDETLPGPWEWDVKRLVASALVAAEAGGADRVAATAVARRAGRSYRASMRRFASASTLDVWYAHLDVEGLVRARRAGKRRKQDEAALARIRRRTGSQVVGKLTERADGGLRFRSIPPLITPLRELVDPADADEVRELVVSGYAAYRESLPPERRVLLDRFRLVDLARKVVGVGSVGTRCLIALLQAGTDDDLLVLQFKEAVASVLEPHLGPSPYAEHGARVVHGQRLVQVTSDTFLGWNTVTGRDEHYYWRQLKDMKASAEIAALGAGELGRYVDTCAWCLARAHARSGDPVAIAAYLGAGESFDKAMAAFAAGYADQTKRDWQALRAAIKDGRLAAATGV